MALEMMLTQLWFFQFARANEKSGIKSGLSKNQLTQLSIFTSASLCEQSWEHFYEIVISQNTKVRTEFTNKSKQHLFCNSPLSNNVSRSVQNLILLWKYSKFNPKMPTINFHLNEVQLQMHINLAGIFRYIAGKVAAIMYFQGYEYVCVCVCVYLYFC